MYLQSMRFTTALILACLITGCSDSMAIAAQPSAQPASPPAATEEISKEALLQAVFGSQYRPATKTALARLPMLKRPDRIRYYDVIPLASSVLKNGVAVLLAQSDYAQRNPEDDNEVIEDEALLNVYLLRQVAGKWTVIQRRDNFMIRGENSGRGSVLFPMLNEDKQGLAIVSQLAMDGCPQQTLYLFDMDHNPIREITGGIATGWSKTQGCDENTEVEQHTSSTWHLAPPKNRGTVYRDVLVTSETRNFNQEGKLIATAKKQTTRYAYDGRKYQKVSGPGRSAQQ